jgi:hypothetical protein
VKGEDTPDYEKMWTKTIGFGITSIILAYIYGKWHNLQLQSLDEKEQNIIESWNDLIIEPKRKFRRISVGYENLVLSKFVLSYVNFIYDPILITGNSVIFFLSNYI